MLYNGNGKIKKIYLQIEFYQLAEVSDLCLNQMCSTFLGLLSKWITNFLFVDCTCRNVGVLTLLPQTLSRTRWNLWNQSIGWPKKWLWKVLLQQPSVAQRLGNLGTNLEVSRFIPGRMKVRHNLYCVCVLYSQTFQFIIMCGIILGTSYSSGHYKSSTWEVLSPYPFLPSRGNVCVQVWKGKGDGETTGT